MVAQAIFASLYLFSLALVGHAKMLSLGYTNCGSPDDVIQIKSLSIDPPIAAPGQNVTVTTVGVFTQSIDHGEVTVTGKLNGYSIFSRTADLCEKAQQYNNMSCTIDAGTYTHTREVTMPSYTAGNQLTITSTGSSQDHPQLYCIQFQVEDIPIASDGNSTRRSYSSHGRARRVTTGRFA